MQKTIKEKKKVDKKQPKKLKQEKRKVEKNEKRKAARPGEISFSTSIMPTSVANVFIEVQMDPTAVAKMLCAFYSHLCQNTSIMQVGSTTSSGLGNYLQIAQGVQYLYEGMIKSLQGGPVTPSNVPLVFREAYAALMPKTVTTRFKSGFTYSWRTPNFVNTFQNITVGVLPYVTTFPNVDNNQYNASATAFTPVADEEEYVSLLSSVDGLTFRKLKTVANTPSDSTLFTSVSAFARNYAYNGLNAAISTANGFYKDIELEVPIFQPNLAQFAPYGSDVRVPRYLAPGAGDACLVYGLQMLPYSGGVFNPAPPIYKFIDFENIYDVLCIWAARAKEAMLSSLDEGYNTNQYTNTFTFTAQDFRIVLRQALMAFFGTGWLTQFIGPVDINSGNYFQAFFCNGSTYGAAPFLEMVMPALIVENLAALKRRVIRCGKLNYNYIPVLGRWVLDVPASYNFNVPTGVEENQPVLTPTALFAAIPQDPIELIDGHSNDPQFVNLNGSYYQNVLADWNSFVNAANAVSIDSKALAASQGPAGLHALTVTRAVNSLDQNPSLPVKEVSFVPDSRIPVKQTSKKDIKNAKQAPPPPPRVPLIAKRVRNYQKATSTEVGVGAIPAATSSMIDTTSFSGVAPFQSESFALLQQLILPSIRFDIEASPPMVGPKYQTETLEYNLVSLNVPNQSRVAGGTASLLQSWQTLAGYCLKGFAGTGTNEYARIMALLSDEGHAGFLSSILGGIAKTVLPSELHGVVDTVADIVPI